MQKSLQKWLLAVGLFLFCWFLVPELEAEAVETYVYDISLNNIKNFSTGAFYDYSLHDFELYHEIDGLTHHFSIDSWNIDIVLDPDDELYVVCLYADLSKTCRAGVYFLVGNSGKVYIKDDGLYDISYIPSSYTLYTGGSLSNYGREDFIYGLYYSNYISGLVTSYSSTFSLSSDENNQLSHVSENILYSTEDIYLVNSDTLVFQHPLPPTPTPTPSPQQRFQTAVEMTNLEAVMIQVVGLAPLLIGLLTTLIGFSKGLRLLFQTLQRV